MGGFRKTLKHVFFAFLCKFLWYPINRRLDIRHNDVWTLIALSDLGLYLPTVMNNRRNDDSHAESKSYLFFLFFFFLVEGKTDEALSHWAKIIKGVCFPTRENSFKLRRTQSLKIPQLIQHNDWRAVCLFDPVSHGGQWWISNARVNTAPPLRRALGSPWGSSHEQRGRQMTI